MNRQPKGNAVHFPFYSCSLSLMACARDQQTPLFTITPHALLHPVQLYCHEHVLRVRPKGELVGMRKSRQLSGKNATRAANQKMPCVKHPPYWDTTVIRRRRLLLWRRVCFGPFVAVAHSLSLLRTVRTNHARAPATCLTHHGKQALETAPFVTSPT